MARWLLLLHRYLGIAVGGVMAMWCMSGIVMMYVQYPELSPRERLAGLEALDLTGCCRLPEGALSGSAPVTRFRLEMLAGVPVLRVDTAFGIGDGAMYDLLAAEAIARPGPERIRAAADGWRRHTGIDGPMRYEGPVQQDQWTVYAAYHAHRPLHRFAADDPAGTQWYVSDTTGEVVQVTTAHERFWNWLGAVIHWLYPTALRQHTALWAQVVIWLTIVGIFLTVIGLYIGIRQFRAGAKGRRSPYRGAALWHHYSGLLFGVLLLSWGVSGLFSMNPWGWLEGESAAPERARLTGSGLSGATVREWVERLGPGAVDGRTVRLEGYALSGRFGVIARDAHGVRRRLAPDGRPEPLTPDDWAALASRLQPDQPIRETAWLTNGDAYYYDHHESLDFPVFRVVFDDPGGSRYYLDGVSGELARKVDAERRWYRWLHYGLHRGDFTGWLRRRPVWDAVMLVLLAGVTVSSTTGAWLALRRLARNATRRRQTRAASDRAATSP